MAESKFKDRDEQYYVSELERLFKKQLETEWDGYLDAHGGNKGIVTGHVRSVMRYLPYVKGPKILDWGCYHAIDSCVLRAALGESLNLHGCDVLEKRGAEFHKYASLRFKHLDDPYDLPYESQSFDTVIASGVIEHVTNPSESLKELYRVLKDDGRLIVTYAPNEYSFTELVQAALMTAPHPRRYTRKSLKRLLIDHGFMVDKCGFHESTPTFASPFFLKYQKTRFGSFLVKAMSKMSPLIDRLWPVNLIGQNIYAWGRRVHYIAGA